MTQHPESNRNNLSSLLTICLLLHPPAPPLPVAGRLPHFQFALRDPFAKSSIVHGRFTRGKPLRLCAVFTRPRPRQAFTLRATAFNETQHHIGSYHWRLRAVSK
ncbi:hypothetical protein BO94DRAFT_586790 [Aspergillus sclerotioniger CBS 115572]|uniref:Uncharacterized protein n=1 Tax=Aspergillus sclerotioniger CBS 115572 TaxID=1450535 RepID=A0A317WFG1_9EURO|nr:hypothetical protein BO94DRAFT_586790 [Aspergillus sclerotioniger CBS 115572]PWY83738.1 hypothetical protein BO94DRAFT_586790 [Aspergillus sclerotioniger CBS 115572]